MKPEPSREHVRQDTLIPGSVPAYPAGAEPRPSPEYDAESRDTSNLASPSSATIPPGKHVPHWPKYLIAAGALALLGMELATRTGWFAPEASVSPAATDAQADRIIAGQDRLLAAIALAEARWQDCLDDLDRAEARDPRGDGDPRVVEERRLAHERLRGTAGRNPLP